MTVIEAAQDGRCTPHCQADSQRPVRGIEHAARCQSSGVRNRAGSDELGSSC